MIAIKKFRNRLLVLALFIFTFIRLTIGRARTTPSVEPRVASRGLLVETPAELNRTQRLLELRGKSPYFHFVPVVSKTVRLSADAARERGTSFDLLAASLPAPVSSNLTRPEFLSRRQRREGRFFAIRRGGAGTRFGLQVTARFPYLRVVPVTPGTVRMPVQLAALTRPATADTADLHAFSINSRGAVLKYVSASVTPVMMSSSCPSSSSSCWSCSGSSGSSCASSGGSSCSSCFCASCSSCASCASCGSCGSCGGCSSCGGCGSCGGCSSCSCIILEM